MNKLTLVILALLLVIPGCTPGSRQPEGVIEAVLETQETEEVTATEESMPTQGVSATGEIIPTEAVVETAEVIPTEQPFTIDDVIEFEMKGAFDFFWEQANTDATSPGYGLIRDRYPGSGGISSIASTGFGLTAYLIGIEKGYISYEQGYERVNKTLDTLLAMDREEGFYFHFVDMQTGKRAWNSEVSNIDTSILLMGVLSAGEYFGGEIKTKAKQIYDGVNWPWFIDETKDMFYMAYSPEKGFAGHWDFYAEQLMLYILAAGSDKHPTDDTAYYTFTRHYAKYGEGEPFIHSWFGSIFTYQFSHAWIDFRETVDREGVNWFDNSVKATRSQVDFAIANDAEYETLGPNAWGLTACDGPEGYNGLYGAPPSGFDNNSHVIDDTIAPSGAIGSIIFLPEEAQQAMLNYYSMDDLKGDYGFFDAYNLSEDWYDSDVIGIDKGISLLMLANYEGDIVYDIIMKNENILKGLSSLQITKKEQGGGFLFTIEDVAEHSRVSNISTSFALYDLSAIIDNATTRTFAIAVGDIWTYRNYYKMKSEDHLIFSSILRT